MIELQADYLKQVNPFEMFEVIEPDEKPAKSGVYKIVYYSNSGTGKPYTYETDDLKESFERLPMSQGDVAFCYWYGTRPGDPVHKERCTIMTAGRAL